MLRHLRAWLLLVAIAAGLLRVVYRRAWLSQLGWTALALAVVLREARA